MFPNNGLHLKDSGLMPPLTESTEAWLEQDLKEMSNIKKIRGQISPLNKSVFIKNAYVPLYFRKGIVIVGLQKA